MRHLVNRHLLLAAAVVRQNAAHTLLWIPQVEHGHAVFAEQAGNVITTVSGNQSVVGLQADIRITRDLRLRPIAHVQHPDFAGVPEREYEAILRCVDEADDLGAFVVVAVGGRYVGNEFEGLRVEYLDAAGLVIRYRDQAPVLRNRATDAVARLQFALDHLGREDIDLAQAAVAAKHVGITRVAGIDHRGVR